MSQAHRTTARQKQSRDSGICGECGGTYKEGARFCTSCGTPVSKRMTQDLGADEQIQGHPPVAGSPIFANKGILVGACVVGAVGVLVAGYFGFQYVSEQMEIRAQQTVVANQMGRIRNSWNVAVTGHVNFQSQVRLMERSSSGPLVSSAARIKSQLQGQIQSMRNALPDYANNPTLAALVNGLQSQAEFYDGVPSLLKQKSWDSVAGAQMLTKLQSAESSLKQVAEKVPNLTPVIGPDFTDLSPLQRHVEHRVMERSEKLAYANKFNSVLNRYYGTRQDMQRIANLMRAGAYSRLEAIAEFRKAQEKRQALRDELMALTPPPEFQSVHNQFEGVFRDALAALDSAIQSMVALGDEAYFDAAAQWESFQRGSTSISRRLDTMESRFGQIKASI